MRNVYLVQVNNTYGRNCFLPYSVALLQAYAQAQPDVASKYTFKGFVYLRDPVAKVVAGMDHPDVVGLSCYIWNSSYSTALAKEIRAKFPNCLIVLGGPHVPVNHEPPHQTVEDIRVHHEGEEAFTEILRERLNSTPNYEHINGITICDTTAGFLKTPPRSRIEDLDKIPSPYLTGIFDELMTNPLDFHASQETHRGCPYQCTFCDWGSSVFTKVRKFGDDRLKAEIKWFSDHKIDLVYNCDANYGLFARDIDLTQYMAQTKRDTGYPCKFRAAYAKNSNEAVYKIAKILHEAGMNKGITLSFQSMDDKTLEIVKRKNIKVTDFKNLMHRYREEGIATYSELILGLPGESYDTFADGLSLMLDCGQHDSVQVYTCEVLPNSEMNDSAYKTKYAIKTTKSPIPMFHSTPSKDKHREFYELVTSTSTMDADQWHDSQMFAWGIQAFHCLGLTQAIAIYLKNRHGISYRTFYEALLKFAKTPETIINKIYTKISAAFTDLQSDGEWGFTEKKFGSIVWPPEEIAFLWAVKHKKRFYRELTAWVKAAFPECEVAKSLLVYQAAIVADPSQTSEITISQPYNLHEILMGARLDIDVPLEKIKTKYVICPPKTYTSDETFATEVIWYGRKGGRFLHTNIKRK